MNNYNNILEFYKDYIKLEQVLRKGWLMCNVPAERIESVADHTLQLIMLASVITKELNIKVDLTKLMEMLLIHDMGEAIIGDISDVEDDFKTKKEKEHEVIRELFDKLKEDNANYYYSLWLEMEDQNTKIAKFAYLLDKLDAVIKAGIYEEQYELQGLFKEFSGLQKNRKTFDDCILTDFFNYIVARYDK